MSLMSKIFGRVLSALFAGVFFGAFFGGSALVPNAAYAQADVPGRSPTAGVAKETAQKAAQKAAQKVAPQGAQYAFGGARPDALAAYRSGWVEILELGRWREAEIEYRKALTIDPNFVIAQSVLARLTQDRAERRQLMQSIEANAHRVDEDGRLLLDVYLKTLELIESRDEGELGADKVGQLRDELAQLAVSNYREFLDKYPGEWSVLIEYVEWIHATTGPEGALQAVESLSKKVETAAPRGFSYFPAYFHAELGEFEQANRLAAVFEARMPLEDLPQPHYLRAFIAFKSNAIALASTEIDQALRLDPDHLLAQRLKLQIEAEVDEP